MLLRSLSLSLLCGAIAAQSPEIYNAGPMVTHPGAGFGGGDASALMNVAPYFMNVFGSNANGALNYSIIDDFATNGVWIVDGIELFTYQTGALAPSITSVFVEIYSADPSTGGLPIAGSPGLTNDLFLTPGYTVTNTMTPVYRTVVGTLTNNQRQIQSVKINFATPLILDPSATGTSRYWLEYRFRSTVSTSGPWVPSITVLGSPNTGSDALQRTAVATWQPWVDAGNPVQPVPYKNGAPFKLYGTPTTAPGAITNLGGAAGTATLAVRGAPHVGGVVHAELTGTSPLAIPLIWIGLANPSLPFGVCTGVQHATLDIVNAGVTSYNWQVPMLPSAVGLQFYLQGGELDFFGAAALPCNLGVGFTLGITDGYEVRFY